MNHEGRERLIHVVCPADEPEEMAIRYQSALQLFERWCPAGARVVDVYGLRETGQLKCAWEVRYVRRNGFDQVEREDLARHIRNSKPNNTSIVKQMKQYPPGLKLIYSVDCNCPISHLADKFANSNTSLHPVDKIEVDLHNLKVEENDF